MKKLDEFRTPQSCFNRAKPEEMLFVLLGRDVAAPAAIRAWIGERILRGKNQPDDPQIREAEACAETMERERRGIYKDPIVVVDLTLEEKP